MAQKRRQRGRRHRQRGQDEVAGLSEPRSDRSDCTTSLEPAKWWITAAVCGLPALAAAAVFANILSNTFVYDDKGTLDRLPQFSGASLWFFLHSGRGLTYLVHLLDRWLWGSWEPGFHLTNIILHSLASSLAAYAAFVLIRSARAALLCGLLFAVHPVHVEVVAMFSYRKDILAMIFVLFALVWWLSTRRPVLCYLASFSCFGLGLLSKEVAAIGLIPMLFLADLLPGHQHPTRWPHRLRRGVWRILPIVVVGIIATTAFAGDILNYFTPQSIDEVTGGQLRTYDQVLATAAGSVSDLVRLLFIPLRLSADYCAPTLKSLRDPDAMLGVIILVFWIAAGALLLRPAPVAAFAVAWPLLLYLPCSNVLPLTKFFIAERYLYVPSFGVCLLIAYGVDRVIRPTTEPGRSWSRNAAVILAMVLLLAGGTRSFLRNRDWRDDHSIWLSSLRNGIDSARIRTNLGNALVRQCQYEEALQHFERAVRINPNHAGLRSNLGVALAGQGQYEGALQHFERALRINPSDPGIRRNVAKALIELGRLDEAAERCRKILQVHAANAGARSLLEEISLCQAGPG